MILHWIFLLTAPTTRHNVLIESRNPL